MAKQKSKRRVIILSILGLLVLGGIGAAVAFGKREKSVEVTVEPVTRRTIIQTVSATGKIQPETLVKVSSEVSGEVIFLGVKEGDTVRKGQLLVRIQPDLVQSQLDQARAASESSKAQIGTAKAELDRAQLDFDRVKKLFDKQFSSKDELDRVTATLNSAKARFEATNKDYERSVAALRQSGVTSGRTVIYAPNDGVIVSLAVEKGEKVLGTAQFQGTEILQLADLSVMNAEVDVDENDVVLISRYDSVRITADAFPGRTFRGYVYQIGNSAKRAAVGTQEEVVNFAVKIRIVDNEFRFRPGMSCDVEIETETRPNVIAVPLQSVTIRRSQDNAKPENTGGGGPPGTQATEPKKKASQKPPSVVFVQDNTKAKMVQVETGISDNGYIEILKGLEEGQTVISGNFRAISKDLEDGSLIKIDTASANKRRGK